MIKVTSQIVLQETDIQLSFIRAPGPGGQNVNKVATAVQLRFDVKHSPSLSEPVRARLLTLAGNKMTLEGELIIKATRYRTQERNKEDAINRLKDLIRQAAVVPKKRKKTKPTRSSIERRLEGKKLKSKQKSSRKVSIDKL